MKVIFFVFLFIVFYTYVGYGILLYLLVKFKTRNKCLSTTNTKHEDYPEVTLFITAYNEEKVIDAKMQNCYEIDYPKNKLKIQWVIDGSNDSSREILDKYGDVVVLFSKDRKGKANAMNRGMQYVTSPIVVFTDANTLINSGSIKEIVNCFVDRNVGCVAGEKRIHSTINSKAASSGEGIYWRYESFLKKYDSILGSTMGAAGELYAIRKELYFTIPNDSLLDDFILSMNIVQKGKKIEYCDKAYAFENGSANMNEEKKRKVRIAAGGMQSIIRLKELLNIKKHKIISFQYISHRVLRWSITPILLFSLLPLNIFILFIYPHDKCFLCILILQIIFYSMAFIGYYLAENSIKNKLLYIPYYFTFMNFNVLKGFIYLRNKKKDDGTWEKTIRA